MGKAYANKKKIANRPKGDFYSTPKSLIWVAEDIIITEFNKDIPLLEPCYGVGAISEELEKLGFKVIKNDLYQGGIDYLTSDFKETQIITNPPFSLWDAFVNKAKEHTSKFMFIGRLNYLGTHSRNTSKIWEGLKHIYCFDRYVDYQTPYREDGNFHVGAMATAWFLWEEGYTDPSQLSILDVQKYATLGNFKC